LRAVREFLAWLQARPGYRRRIAPEDIAYLNLTTKDVREAHVSAPKAYPSLDQYRAALFAMPAGSDVERRDRALMALLLLTGMRDAAVIGLKLRHISIERRHVFQDPREVNTKFSKAIETYFFPVGEDVVAIVAEWVTFLTCDRLFSPHDPLFPKTAVEPDEHGSFGARGLSREHWANATPVRTTFKQAFARAGLPYFKPHSVRDTLTQLAYKLQLGPEELKAWSQNLGHGSVLTTLHGYGQVPVERQGEILAGLPGFGKTRGATDMAAEIAAKVVAQIAERDLIGSRNPRLG